MKIHKSEVVVGWSDMKFWMKKFERSENERQNTAEGGMSLQRSSICDGRIIAFRPADTEVDLYLLPKIITNAQ